MDIVYLLVLLTIGILLGAWGATVMFHSNKIGTIRADMVDPDSGPSLLIELDRENIDWGSMNYVIFKVDVKNREKNNAYYDTY